MLEFTFYNALQQPSGWIVLLSFAGGVVSTLLPCSIAMVPILIGYMGGYGDTSNKKAVVLQTVLFVVGLALTFSVFGTVAALAGATFGSWLGPGWYILMGVLAIVMALQLLEVIQIPLPSFVKTLPIGVESKQSGWKQWVPPLVLGVTFGAATSPCGTPFLAGILGLISNTKNIGLGALSLFAYAVGQGTLVLIAGLFTGFLKNLATVRRIGSVFSKLSGAVFILAGITLILEGTGVLGAIVTSLSG